MRIILQRVSQAACHIDKKLYSQINKGYLLLVGFNINDNQETIDKLAKKISKLRINEDENHKMNLDIHQVNGEILSISQFTLYADAKKGNRPSFTDAAPAELAKPLYEKFNQALINNDLKVQTGVFQADMKISLINDGPVTIILDSETLC